MDSKEQVPVEELELVEEKAPEHGPPSHVQVLDRDAFAKIRKPKGNPLIPRRKEAVNE